MENSSLNCYLCLIWFMIFYNFIIMLSLNNNVLILLRQSNILKVKEKILYFHYFKGNNYYEGFLNLIKNIQKATEILRRFESFKSPRVVFILNLHW